MDDNKGDDLDLPESNLPAEEPIAPDPTLGSADEGSVPGDSGLDQLDIPMDDLLSEDAAPAELEPAEIDPDLLSPDPLAETTEFEPDADELLSPNFGGDESMPDGLEPEGLDFPIAAEDQSDESGKDGEEESKEEEEEDEEEKEAFLEKLAKTSPYTVMLGVALLAIVVAVLCLFMELKLYDFETKPEGGRVMNRSRATSGCGIMPS